MTNPTGISTLGSEGEGTWRVRVPVVRGKEGRLYIKTPSNVGIDDTPNGELLFEIDDRDLEPALKYLNALTRKAAAYDEAVKMLETCIEHGLSVEDGYSWVMYTCRFCENGHSNPSKIEHDADCPFTFLSSLEGRA